MSARDPAKAVLVLDLVEAFFAGGTHWLQGDWRDDDGNRCLVNALDYVRRKHRITGDGASYYLRRAMPHPGGLPSYNDHCQRFVELRALIELARRLAIAESRGDPKPWRSYNMADRPVPQE